MAQRIGIVVAGEGAIARQHTAALRRMDDVDVVGVAGGDPDGTASFAAEFEIPRHGLDLAEMLDGPGVDAAILASPTPVHAAQAIEVMDAGKHVLIEIPMADSLTDAEAVVAPQPPP